MLKKNPAAKTRGKNVRARVPACMISEQMADELLWQRNTPHRVVVHSHIVARLAESLAVQLREKLRLEGLSPEHFYSAGLLHDFAKEPGAFQPGHSWLAGRELFSIDRKVAELAGYHDFLNFCDRKLPFSKKLFVYCDLRVSGGKIVPLEQRVQRIIGSVKKELNSSKADPRAKKLILAQFRKAFENAKKFEEWLKRNGIEINPSTHRR